MHVLTPAFNGQLSNPPGPVVPLRNPGAAADPAGIISVALEVVPSLTFGRANNPNTANQLMQAVGAQGAAVFGLFAFGDGSDAHWEQLGVVPIDTRRESIAALATLDGNIIFVGTQGGRLFALTAASGFAAVQLPTPVANPQTGGNYRSGDLKFVSGWCRLRTWPRPTRSRADTPRSNRAAGSITAHISVSCGE